MGYLGYKPADKPLTAADITDSIITSAKITDATIVNGDIANSTIALAKLSATGTPSISTFLRGDNSWGSAGAAAGQVIQVLGATDSTARTTTSTSFVTGSNTLSVTITPSATSSKFAIFVNHYAFNANAYGWYTIARDGTNLGGTNGLAQFNSAAGAADGHISYFFLDSPSTTSAITYQAYMKTAASNTQYMGSGSQTAQIIVMEIKG
jgi:hypothetical protein